MRDAGRATRWASRCGGRRRDARRDGRGTNGIAEDEALAPRRLIWIKTKVAKGAKRAMWARNNVFYSRAVEDEAPPKPKNLPRRDAEEAASARSRSARLGARANARGRATLSSSTTVVVTLRTRAMRSRSGFGGGGEDGVKARGLAMGASSSTRLLVTLRTRATRWRCAFSILGLVNAGADG